MKFLDKVTKNEARFQRYIGLNFKELSILTHKVDPIWKMAELERLSSKKRIRKIGGGRSYKFNSISDKIVVTLLYYKQYLTQELLGDLVGMDQANISRLLKKMSALLEEAADPKLKTFLTEAKEDCQKRIGNIMELYNKYPDLRDVSTDATEQQCYRSKNYEEQKKHYSGKSKQHAIKIDISTSITGRILNVSNSYAGSTHDKTIIDKEKTIEKFDKRVPHRFDSGYQGIKNEYSEYYIISPTKKPKGRELTKSEKELNRVNSKMRIVVEHAFARIKKFKIFANVFRQSLDKHNQAFRNVVAILNFKLQNLSIA